MTIAKDFSDSELRAEQASAIAEYHGLEMAVSPVEAKRRLQSLQAFVQSVMVKDADFGVIPGTGEKPTLLQPGAQKLAELYGLSHRFEVVEQVKDWERGFFYFEYRCVLSSRRDGSHIGDGIGSCNSRESRYAARWVFGNQVPAGVDISTLKSRKGRSKKTGNEYVQYLMPNDDPYSIVNTLQKMAAKRAYIHAVIGATRSSGLFTQDVEDLPPEAFGDVEPAHDAETGEIVEAPAPPTSKQLAEMHLKRFHEATTKEEWRQAREALNSDQGRINKTDFAYLRAMAKEQQEKIVAANKRDTEPAPPDAMKDAAL